MYLMFCPYNGLTIISIYTLSLFEDLFICFTSFASTTAVDSTVKHKQ